MFQLCEDDLGIRIDSTDILRRQCSIAKVLEEVSPDFTLFTVMVTEELASVLKDLHNEHLRNIVALAQYRQVWKRGSPEGGDDKAATAEWADYKLRGRLEPEKYAIVWNSVGPMPAPHSDVHARSEADEESANNTMKQARNMPLDNFPDPRTILSMSSNGLKDEKDFILYWRAITGNTIRTFGPLPPGFPEKEGSRTHR